MWFMCLGSAAAVVYAVQLVETGLTTAGSLPPPPEDETCIQASLPSVQRRDAHVVSDDVCLLHLPPAARSAPVTLLVQYKKVQVHQYSLHFCDVDTSEKIGSNLILRGSLKPDPLLVALMRTKGIVKLTVDGLARLMQEHQVPGRKTMTKSARIRELMQLSAVKDSLASEELAELETLLTKMDERRLKRTPKEDEEDEDDDPEEPMDLHDPDPAVDAARQMLVQIEQEEDIIQICFVMVQLATISVEPLLFWTCMSVPVLFLVMLQDDDRQAAASGGEMEMPKAREEMMQVKSMTPCFHRDVDKESKGKESKLDSKESQPSSQCRRWLTNAAAIPNDLLQKWPVPPGITIAHTTTVDTTLPLFQARLVEGSYNGKSPGIHVCVFFKVGSIV
ncbi:hypothetical protein AK812_SmicGene28485 [Symbiodinium microadriaticum]|uniref:Uncharacterized protein n=1 Tax=Symbiodinium microadriaticum TaxID=2951 RepID=A0A1Q9D482_SYMMI|nr:hypothetical protein AK812_SmicGene28485 [Symbiodinium microadriaticum]